MSEMLGSFRSGSSGPRPKISSRISRERRSRSAKLRGTASLLTVLRMSSNTSSRAASLGVRPSFSRSSRSRILRWRSALTCWYSARSKVCKFGIDKLRVSAYLHGRGRPRLPKFLTVHPKSEFFRNVLNRFEQRPGTSFHVNVVFCQASGKSSKRTRNLRMILMHQRNAPVDRRRDCKILIRNLPEQLDSCRRFGVRLAETRNFAEPIQHELHTLAGSGFAEILLQARSTP